MESSYKKLSKQRDETIFIIKKALKERQIHAKHAAENIETGKDQHACYELQNIQDKVTLDEMLDELAKLYEIQ